MQKKYLLCIFTYIILTIPHQLYPQKKLPLRERTALAEEYHVASPDRQQKILAILETRGGKKTAAKLKQKSIKADSTEMLPVAVPAGRGVGPSHEEILRQRENILGRRGRGRKKKVTVKKVKAGEGAEAHEFVRGRGRISPVERESIAIEEGRPVSEKVAPVLPARLTRPASARPGSRALPKLPALPEEGLPGARRKTVRTTGEEKGGPDAPWEFTEKDIEDWEERHASGLPDARKSVPAARPAKPAGGSRDELMRQIRERKREERPSSAEIDARVERKKQAQKRSISPEMQRILDLRKATKPEDPYDSDDSDDEDWD